jgi:hypothetical protein
MAKRNPAIHAARSLLFDLAVRHGNGEFPEVPNAIRRGLILADLPVDLEKTCNLTHKTVPMLSVAAATLQA